MHLLKSLTYCLLVLLAPTAAAQAFEGIIELNFYTPIDTSHYKYYLKDGKARIEEYTFDKRLKSISFINESDRQTTTFYPERQVYLSSTTPSINTQNTKNLRLEKGKKTKVIAGYECQEWIAKSKLHNFMVVYYVPSEIILLPPSLQQFFQKKDKIFSYQQHFEELKDKMPLFAIEIDMKKNPRISVEVTSVAAKLLDASYFELPLGYKKLETR
jgi:hypothetical protein